jgi:zinc protease
MSALFDAEKFLAVREAMLAEVQRMKNEPVSAEELNKAMKQFMAATLASRTTMQGHLNFSARYLEAVKRITPKDLQRVAREYLTAENRTLYTLLPAGTSPKLTAQQDLFTDTAIQKFDLPNGLRLLVKEDHRLPFVEFRAVCKGGVLAETPANNGASLLLTKMLLQGTSNRGAAQIASEIESVGGHIDTYGGNNSFGISAEVLSQDFAIGLDLVADVLLNPAFPTDALERERQIQIAQIRSQRDDLLLTAGRLMRREMFGDASYGLHATGTEASVQQIGVSGLQQLHRALVVPNNCVVAIFGDVQAAEVKSAVEKRFDLLKSTAAPFQDLGSLAPNGEPKRVVETRDKKQAVLVIGYRGASIHNEDRYALELIQEACSDLGSRLFMRIREKLGLAYYVGAQNLVGLVPGYFAFYVGTDPAKVKLVESEMLAEAEILREHGLTEEELKRSKAKVIGQKKIARQDLGGYALTAALDELYGLGYQRTDLDDARYEAVTLDEVKAVARKYLKPESVVIAIVQPPKNE